MVMAAEAKMEMFEGKLLSCDHNKTLAHPAKLATRGWDSGWTQLRSSLDYLVSNLTSKFVFGYLHSLALFSLLFLINFTLLLKLTSLICSSLTFIFIFRLISCFGSFGLLFQGVGQAHALRYY